MNKAFLAAAIAASLLAAACSDGGGGSSAGGKAECRPLNLPSLGQAADAMRREGFDAALGPAAAPVSGSASGDAVVWKLQGGSAVVTVGRGGTHLNVQMRSRGEGASEAAVNFWNDDREFSRTYIDEGGEAVLEMDLDFDGGICEENLHAFFRDCAASIEDWLETVPGH
ncbi:MAG: YbjN domain-containing protein [Deltaproteobacteria bacterium]|jgi:hypothetical protein|nr:YbjN domain-containing protein [Deltaproteobacteria bacterium]